jgi:hypothetical protein
MTARRPLLLCVLFLGSVWVVGSPTPAAGQVGTVQDAGPYLPGATMTPEQVRAALGRIGGLPPDQDPFNELIRQHIARQGHKVDPKLLQEAIDKVRGNKALMDQLEKMAREQQATGRPPDAADLERALRNVPLKDVITPKWPPRGDPTPGNRKVQSPETPLVGAPPPQKGPPRGPRTEDRPQPNPAPGRGSGRPQDFGMKDTPPRGKGEPRAIQDQETFPPFNRPEAAEPFANPFTDPKHAHRDQAMRTAAALWERNVGPLDETPTVRNLLFDLVTGTEDITDGKGNNIWDALGKDTGDGSSFGDWFDKAGPGDGWKLSSLDIGSTSLGRWWSGSGRESSSGGDWSLGGSSGGGSSGPGWSMGSGGGFGFGGLEGSWLPVVILAAVLLGVLVWWRFWYLRDPVRTGWEPPEGLGPWPLDPRHIATREDLVRAFEYLSVLICGMEARTWTHGTIAQALAGLAATQGHAAALLARLYELARYAPLDEPLTPGELAEGRGIVCQLAGVRSS